MDEYQVVDRLVRGDDDSMELKFTDCDNDDLPLDITGYTVMYTVKVDAKDADEDAILAIDVTEHTNPAQGVTVIEVTDAKWETGYKGNPVPSGQYCFDIQYVDTDGKPKTVIIGTVTIIQDVTHRKVAA